MTDALSSEQPENPLDDAETSDTSETSEQPLSSEQPEPSTQGAKEESEVSAKKPASKKPAAKKKAPRTSTRKNDQVGGSKVPAKRGGRGAPVKYDYVLLRQQFVEGYPLDATKPDGDRDWPNLRELSERTNVPYERVRERSAKERWLDLRSAHQQKMVRDRQAKRSEFLGKESVEFDNRNLDLSKLGLRLIGTRMAEIAREVQTKDAVRKRAEEDLRSGLPVDWKDLKTAVNSRELETLGKAAQMWQEIGMKALGTDVERHSIEANINQNVNVEATISVAAELERDDPDRLAAFMAAAERAGIWEQLELTAGPEGSGHDEDEHDDTEHDDADGVIYDAEVID